MLIKTSPEDYIINAVRDIGWGVESDFLLRLLVIENDNEDVLSVNSLTFKLISNGKNIKEIRYGKDILPDRIEASIDELNCYRDNTIFECIGMDKFWTGTSLSRSLQLNRGEQMVFWGEYFRVSHSEAVDRLKIEISCTQKCRDIVYSYELDIKEYKNKNQYIFPVKGAWMATDIYTSVDSHRWCYNSEFAFDLGQLHSDFMLINKDNMDNTDYEHYGKSVYACCDGEVVDCFDGFPEYSLGYCKKKPKEHYDDLEKIYGPLARTAGNYIVIQHPNDECTFYCHMIPGSIAVKKGDMVKQGQQIGKVGNAGSSNCPHLHFHLMDGPDGLRSRGLPCYFINIKNIFNQKIDFIDEDGMIVITE